MKWITATTINQQVIELALDASGTLYQRVADQVLPLGSPQQFIARMGEKRRYAELELPNIGVVRTNEVHVIDAWFAHLDLSGERHRKHAPAWAWAWGILGSIILSIVLLFWLGVPWLARTAAAHMPVEWEKSLSEGTLQSLDSDGFTASTVSADEQSRYRALFAKVTEGANYGLPIKLEFRNWTDPNAFAIPGGTVVITDQMLKLMTSDNEFTAVMAHEVGHLVHRHGVRSVLQTSGTWIIIGTMMGDASGLASITTALPAVLVDSAYSRDFEREADQYAFQQLKARGISPKAFASLMKKLQDETEKSGSSMQYFSSHPPTDERIAAAERAANQ